MRHVLERRIEPQILGLQLRLALAQGGGSLLDKLVQPAIELFKLRDHERNRAVGAVAVAVRFLVGFGNQRKQSLQIKLAGTLCRLGDLSGEELMHQRDPSPPRSW